MIRHLYSNDMSMRSYKPPFAHADLTMPERRLRVALQKLTREKNEASGGRRGFDPRTESVRQYWGETYYHDGKYKYKQLSFVFCVWAIQFLGINLLKVNYDLDANFINVI